LCEINRLSKADSSSLVLLGMTTELFNNLLTRNLPRSPYPRDGIF
jgi:hypothetical protein